MAFYDLKYLEDTFIHYVKQNTRSYEENHDQVPSSPDQVKMGKELAKALKEIGLVAYYNEKNGFAIGHLKKNVEDDVTPIGFFSHIDTADFNAENIKPQIHRNYDGKRIALDKENNIYLDPKEFPALASCKGDYF